MAGGVVVCLLCRTPRLSSWLQGMLNHGMKIASTESAVTRLERIQTVYDVFLLGAWIFRRRVRLIGLVESARFLQ